MIDVAESTLAMSVYNLLAVAQRALQPGQIAAQVRQLGSAAELGGVERALAELVKRGLVKQVRPGLYDARGPGGWVVFRRDRTGDGWSGWTCRNLTTSEVMPLATLLQNGAR